MENKEFQERFIDERTRIEYLRKSDYYMPNLVMKKEKVPAGKYALMRYDYLRNYKKYELTILIMNEKLNKHLEEIQKTATKRVENIIKKLKEQNNLTEEIKNSDPLYWVGMMNNFKNQAEEIVLNDLIYV